MLKSWLTKKGYDAATAKSVEEAKTLIKDRSMDLVLSDIRMPEADGFSFLSWIKKYDSAISVIMMTSFSDVETAVESLKMGAVDYIAKPIDPQTLFRKIKDAFKLQENKLQNELHYKLMLKPPSDNYKKLFKHLDTIAFQNTPVLITGARGTGKASAARYIYGKGYGLKKPFVQIDEDSFGGMPFSINGGKSDFSLLDELKKASGGVLYICEVENLSKNLQNDLLSFLQSQKNDGDYTRVIVSSTKTIDDLKATMLPKLLHLFAKDTLHLMPVKGQETEILFFVDHFLSFANSEFGKDIKKIAPEFMEKLLGYDWPGNIQEIKNIIIKAILLTEGPEIKASIIPELFKDSSQDMTAKNVPDINMEALKKENYEKTKIMEALGLAKGNKTLAASILNIDRKTLYNKIKIYNVDLPN